MKKLLATLIASLVFVSAFTGCTGNKDETVLGTYGDEKFLVQDFLYFYATRKMDVESQAFSSGQYTEDTIDAYWMTENEGLTNEQYLRNLALQETEQYATLIMLAKQAGITVDEQEVESSNKAVDDAVKSLATGGKSGEREFQAIYGISSASVKGIYRNFSIINQYTSNIVTDNPVSDEDISSYYELMKDGLKQVTVRHILMDTQEKDDEQKEAAKLLAEDLLAQIQAGADIGELAEEYSEDGGSNTNKGEYTFGRYEMVQEFEDFAFNANDGDTGIVETTYGYHVMQLISSSTPTLEEKSEEIRSMLLDQMMQEKLNEFIGPYEGSWVIDENAMNDAIK